MRKQLNSLECI